MSTSTFEIQCGVRECIKTLAVLLPLSVLVKVSSPTYVEDRKHSMVIVASGLLFSECK